MTTDNIQWTGDHDDFTARVDGYTLRAEKVGPGCWWWMCYCHDGGNKELMSSFEYADSEEQAKAKAVGAMNGHRGRG
jgi:hypothetical protein